MAEKVAVPNRFHKRLAAIIKRSTDYQKSFSSDDSIFELLDKFVAFSQGYIQLLGRVPPEIARNPFAINRGVESLLQDWNVLSRASEQRLITGFGDELKGVSALAQVYCERWNKSAKKKNGHTLRTPVVYFEKIYRISRSIYAPEIPVISIPLTDFDQKENWQALAHEFSHHIFWNGLGLDDINLAHQNLRNSLAETLAAGDAVALKSRQDRYKLPKPKAARVALWENWLEEVFADVFGTLLAGPAYALSSQDLIAERINRINDFAGADLEHPCNYLRPLISLQVLEEIAGHTPSDRVTLDKLRERWMEFSHQAGSLIYKDFSLASLGEDVQHIVKLIVDGKYWPRKVAALDLVDVTVEDWSLHFDRLAPVTAIGFEEASLLSISAIRLPKVFSSLKHHLDKISSQVLQRADSSQKERDATLIKWSSLLGLELSEPEGYHVHSCASDHDHLFTWFWSGHEHGELGTELRQC